MDLKRLFVRHIKAMWSDKGRPNFRYYAENESGRTTVGASVHHPGLCVSIVGVVAC